MSQSQWYVITGAPSSGKTAIIAQLAKAGYKTTCEAARMIIDEGVVQGKTIEEIRLDESIFQQWVIERSLKTEASLPRNEVIFLDRALPDTLAYYRLAGQDISKALLMCQRNFYRKVFCLELLGFVKDYARIECGEIMEQLHGFLQEVYGELGYEIVLVPVMPIQDRVQFILDRIDSF